MIEILAVILYWVKGMLYLDRLGLLRFKQKPVKCCQEPTVTVNIFGCICDAYGLLNVQMTLKLSKQFFS